MSDKDTFWFKHDNEPTSDPKIQAMLSDYGGFGYGIFWRIVEMLHSDTEHKLPFKKYIYSAIAKQMQANAHQNNSKIPFVEITTEMVEFFVKDCINEYELFTCDTLFFWSDRAMRNIEKKQFISEIRSKAAKNRSETKQMQANDEQMQTNDEQVSANFPIEENRGEDKENKKKESQIEKGGFSPPATPDVLSGMPTNFFTSSDFNGLPEKKLMEIIIHHRSVKNVEVEPDRILPLWENFKSQNLTGLVPYSTKDDVYLHFYRMMAKKSFSKKREIKEKKSTQGKAIGVEYINDYMQCKMSDGSVVDLTANQTAMGKYQGIKPSTITKS